MANSVGPDQTAPIGADCSGSTLFASLLNSPVMLGNNLQQTTSADLQLTIRGSGKLKQTITKLLALLGGIKNLHFQEQWG